MTDLRQLLGTNIKINRKSRGLSQSKLAELAETATNYISAIEAGRRFPSVEMLERIASVLEIDTPELFSVKTAELDNAINELEEQIWQEVGLNLTTYIAQKVIDIKKNKLFCRSEDKK